MPFFNTAYVCTNNDELANAGCYLVNDGPFFDFACIFAANLVWDAQLGQAALQFNQTVSHTLDQTRDVATLQAKGIKVLLSVLNNHDQAGWSCFTDEASAAPFVKQLADCVSQYGLDGIDIDDEYSNGQPNPTSLIMVTWMMKQSMPGKIISKALFNDLGYFQTSWNGMTLAQNLDYGWEMSYFNPDGESRLAPYLGVGMQKAQLALGMSMDMNDPGTAGQGAAMVQANGYGGMMIYDTGTGAAPMCTAISQVFDNAPTTVAPNCLQQSRAETEKASPSPPEAAASPPPPPPPDAGARTEAPADRRSWLRRLLDRLFGG